MIIHIESEGTVLPSYLYMHENNSVSVIGNRSKMIAAVSDNFEVHFEGALATLSF